MIIYKHPLFDRFRCIAGQCPDSCCKEWSVCVDPDAAAFYRKLPGELGERLRQVLREEDADTVMTIENGRCPMWRQDGLCRIQAELDHDALCKTCREFPRLTHDYGSFQEWGLELSCPEAARMLLNTTPSAPMQMEIPGGEPGDYDEEIMAILRESRQEAFALLGQDRPIGEIFASVLLYAYQVQAALDGDVLEQFHPDAALETARAFAAKANHQPILDFFKDLEILAPQWSDRLDHPSLAPWQRPHLTLAHYFIDRYWLQAVSDYDLVCRVKFMLISCLVVKILGGDLVQTAQRYSKEIENDPDNVEAILDAAYNCPAFTDDKLLGLLLEEAL